MKYIALVLAFALMVSCKGCGTKGVQWTYDGNIHTFGWEAWR